MINPLSLIEIDHVTFANVPTMISLTTILNIAYMLYQLAALIFIIDRIIIFHISTALQYMIAYTLLLPIYMTYTTLSTILTPIINAFIRYFHNLKNPHNRSDIFAIDMSALAASGQCNFVNWMLASSGEVQWVFSTMGGVYVAVRSQQSSVATYVPSGGYVKEFDDEGRVWMVRIL